MKFILVFLVIVIIINASRAKVIFDNLSEKGVSDSDLNAPRPPLYIMTKTRSLGLFPSLPNGGKKYIVNLKRLVEIYRQATNPEQYHKPLMRKLSIKYINYKDTDKVKAEVTTRRSLMKAKKFTVKPHDVYVEPVREKYNWNSKRKILMDYSRIPKSERKFKEAPRLINSNFDTKLNDNDNNKSEKHENQNSYNAAGSLKSKSLLLFPKRNNTKYFKGNPEQTVSEPLQINNIVSESTAPSNKASSDIIIEENENITIPSNIFIKSDPEDQMDEMTEPKDNFFDLDKKDQVQFISVKGANEMSPDFAVDDEITTDSDIEYLVSRPKRSINIIEEENVAPTFSGITITNQDYAMSHDLTFKNIYT